jgi:hypothetical protein
MSGSPKEKLHTLSESEEVTEEREVYLKDGRKLVLGEVGRDQLVEIRNESGMLELRIVLTEQGPVLQMEAVKLQLKATESVEIESAKVAIKGTEQVQVTGGELELKAEQDIDVEANGEVHVNGKMIYLN